MASVKMTSLMEYVKNARRDMESRRYDGAYKEYSIVARSLSGLEGIDENGLYRDEIVTSLEILSKRQGLVDEINVKRDGVKKLEDAEYEYEATEFCGSEHTAAWYSLTGLQRAGYGSFKEQLKRLESELQTYESKLLELWQERTQQICV